MDLRIKCTHTSTRMPNKESAIEWMKSVKKAIHEENGKDYLYVMLTFCSSGRSGHTRLSELLLLRLIVVGQVNIVECIE